MHSCSSPTTCICLFFAYPRTRAFCDSNNNKQQQQETTNVQQMCVSSTGIRTGDNYYTKTSPEMLALQKVPAVPAVDTPRKASSASSGITAQKRVQTKICILTIPVIYTGIAIALQVASLRRYVRVYIHLYIYVRRACIGLGGGGLGRDPGSAIYPVCWKSPGNKWEGENIYSSIDIDIDILLVDIYKDSPRVGANAPAPGLGEEEVFTWRQILKGRWR